MVGSRSGWSERSRYATGRKPLKCQSNLKPRPKCQNEFTPQSGKVRVGGWVEGSKNRKVTHDGSMPEWVCVAGLTYVCTLCKYVLNIFCKNKHGLKL